MSSILKALEKVEDAQNQKRNPGAGGLGRKRERRPAWLIPAWSLGGAAVATLVTYSIMGGFSKPAPPAAQVVATAPQPAAQKFAPVAKAVAPPAPVATPEQVAPAPIKTPVAPAAAKPEPKRPVAKQPAKGVKAQLSVKVPVPPSPVRPAAAHVAPAPAAPVAVLPQRQVALDKSRQEISVTGIAWQNDSQSSFAMVNGRPVRQGAVVDGYKVEQIFEDSVRFSGAKGSVTIPLGASEQ